MKMGEIFVFGGRRTGKSLMMTMLKSRSPYHLINSTKNDNGDVWYTISANSDVREWIESQNSELWTFYKAKELVPYYNVHDIHESLYTMLVLKWL